MANINLRSVKGSPLTNAEVDANFSSLDNAKLELSGGTMTGAITFAGAQALPASQITGTVAVTNGGTGASTESGARTNLGATTIGGNLFTLTNPGAITFPRFNANNTVSSLSASDFRTAIGAGTGSVTSVAVTVPTGLAVSGSPITTSGTLGITLASGYVIPTTAKQTEWDSAFSERLQWDGGSIGLNAATGRTSLGATTIGANVFTLTNPGAITFPRFNADNTVSTLSAADFRTAIGAGTSSTTGTVTSVGGTGSVNGITLSGSVTSSGNLTLGGALSGVSLSTQVTGTLPVANGGTGQTTTQAAINSLAGATTSGQYLRGNGTNVVMSSIQAGDVPTLNQNTTGTASNVTGTVAVANGGTGSTTQSGARTGLGASTIGSNLFTLANPGAITFPRFNADNTVSSLSATDFRTAIGAAPGTVTSVDVSGGTTGLTTSGGPVTSSGTITLAGTLAVANGGTGATTNTAARTNLGATTVGSNLFTLTNPSAIRFLRVNADNTVSALTNTDFRTAIGAGTGNGTVTSVSGTGNVNGISLSGSVTTSGSLSLSGSLSIDSLVGNFNQFFNVFLAGAYERQVNLGVNSGSLNIQLTLYNWFSVTVNGNSSFNIAGVDQYGGNTQNIWMLEIANGGAHTITWPSNIKWPGGTAPALTASGTDLIAFTKASGFDWRGFLVGKDIK
jgi:hypothetical protein